MTNIVTLDIETSPIEAYVWGLWDQNIGLDMIKTDRTVMSYSAKPIGAPAYFEHTGGRGKNKVRDDKQLIRELANILDWADLVITQNGVKFDIKIINARMAFHNIKPYSPIRVIDTLVAAKKHFGFISNKLAWTSKLLTDAPKDDHKKFPGFQLWLECLADNPLAWKEMEKYNVRDVVATEKLYLRLRPWLASHPNLAVYTGEEHACPKCGSKRVQKRGQSVSQASAYQRYQCSDCGGWSRSKPLLTPLKTRKGILVPA